MHASRPRQWWLLLLLPIVSLILLSLLGGGSLYPTDWVLRTAVVDDLHDPKRVATALPTAPTAFDLRTNEREIRAFVLRNDTVCDCLFLYVAQAALGSVEPFRGAFAAAGGFDDFLVRRSLLYLLLHQQRAWTYDAMLRFLEVLRYHMPVGLGANIRTHTAGIDDHASMAAERASKATPSPSGAGCWAHVWDQFSTYAAVTVRDRLFRFGGFANNNGIIYVCAGFEGLVTTFTKGSSFRKGWFPQRDVALSAARGSIRNFTILFLTFHDHDVYFTTRANIRDRNEIILLLRAFPNFFFMHYSPSMVMPHGVGASALGNDDPFFIGGVSVLSGQPRTVGALYPRMIPVPHSLTQEKEIQAMLHNMSMQPDEAKAKTPMVVWRGATTGKAPAPYSRTDRFRMVAAFAGYGSGRGNTTTNRSRFDWADVAFSGTCQGVKRDAVPRFAEKLSASAMLKARVHLDVDGNSNSWEGLRWRLLVGVAVVKVASSQGFTQWYYHHLVNGTHLVVVPVDRVADAAKQLLDDVAGAARMAAAAAHFGRQYLTERAIIRTVDDAVYNAWRIGYDDTFRWCIGPC